MKPSADRPARRRRQMIGDLLVMVWAIGWVSVTV